jgi:hypothetical protein
MSYPLLVCTASAGTDPCALVTEAEVATALGAPVETKPPHHVRRNGDLVGGDCFYRSRTQSQDGVTISVDEHPGVDREANLGRQCSRHESILIPGLGDIACAFESPVGLVRVQDYILELTRGGKTARGRIELADGIMRMIPKQGQTQELKLRVVDRGAFELTDQKGGKTMMRRTFR